MAREPVILDMDSDPRFKRMGDHAYERIVDLHQALINQMMVVLGEEYSQIALSILIEATLASVLNCYTNVASLYEVKFDKDRVREKLSEIATREMTLLWTRANPGNEKSVN